METTPIRRALMSVSDKTGLLELAHALLERDVEIFSTGGTARQLRDADIPVRDIDDYTQFPEMLDGRVKTLHPRVFGGILARRDIPDHMETIAQHGIVPFDLVVVNLYPFEATVARSGVSESEAIEQIDIGGPSLIRAAAKNFAAVAVVTDATQYTAITEGLAANGGTTLPQRRALATAAFQHTARYDAVISEHLQATEQRHDGDVNRLPARITLPLVQHARLRYGENPHQQGQSIGSRSRGIRAVFSTPNNFTEKSSPTITCSISIAHGRSQMGSPKLVFR